MNRIAVLVAQRLGLGLISLFVVTLFIASGVELLPGDLAETLLGQDAEPESVAAFRKEIGLDLPFHLRYINWLGDVARGDFGHSLANSFVVVSELLAERVSNSFFLAAMAASIGVPIGLSLGVLSALYRNSAFDRTLNVVNLTWVSLPDYFIGYILILFLAINAGIFPDELTAAAPLLAVLAVVNVLYGAFIVMRQTDLKRLVAYSSVSHMGFVVLGLASVGAGASEINAAGLNGAALQLFSHGVITGLLFVVVGLVYDRAHTRHIPDMGGMARQMPLIAVGFVIAGLAALGLPTTAGFVAEIMIFLGTFPAYGLATALSAFGVVLAAGYILWTVQRTMFGPRIERWDQLGDARLVDIGAMSVLLIPIFVVGIYPAIITDVFDAGLAPIFSRFGG